MAWSGVKGKALVEEINVRGVEPTVQPDPGDGGNFEVSRPAVINIATAGAETRTLADPVFIGQVIDLFFIVDGGDCTVTASSPINQTGNNTLIFSDIGEHIRLVGHFNATDGWEWRVIANDGVALSTV